MELSEVTEVIELNNYHRTNEYLKAGWKLLSTYVVEYDVCSRMDDQTQCYTLGWIGECPMHPKSPYDSIESIGNYI